MDYLYTDDLVKRIDEIETELEEGNVTPAEAEELKSEAEEIETIEGYCEDFRHGATLIPESEFKSYAENFAEEIGAISSDAQWPLGCIDWDRAASELAMDYTLVEYQGTSYYVR